MSVRFFYVPMPINADGNGPASPSEAVKIIHQVWDEENISFCSCDHKEYADAIVASLNREDKDAKTILSLVSALIECEDYFDRFADADCDQDGFIPNEEMCLLSKVQEAISKVAVRVPTSQIYSEIKRNETDGKRNDIQQWSDH